MPIRLPKVLDISDDVLVAIIQQLAKRERCLCSRFRILVPIRWKAEFRGLERENVELTSNNLIGCGAVERSIKIAADGTYPSRRVTNRKLSGFGESDADLFHSSLNYLPDAITDFPAIHGRKAVDCPNETHADAPYSLCHSSRLSMLHNSFSWFCRPAMCSSR